MPLVDSNDAALWDGGAGSLYSIQPVYGGPVYGYVREMAQCYVGSADKLIAALESVGLVQGQRIALIGAGFGWVAEKFLDAGYGPMADGTANGKICAIDTSTWIQSNKTGNANVAIIDTDVTAATGRRTIRQQFGSNNADVDWCISEDVLTILSDNECEVFASAVRQLVPNVAHWLSVRLGDGTGQDARLNWKTLPEWKALLGSDYVIQRGTNVIL